jgi:hypothetical protein
MTFKQCAEAYIATHVKGSPRERAAQKSKVAPPRNFAALPYAELPAFMADLDRQDGIGALALKFTILASLFLANCLREADAQRDPNDLSDKPSTKPGQLQISAAPKHLLEKALYSDAKCRSATADRSSEPLGDFSQCRHLGKPDPLFVEQLDQPLFFEGRKGSTYGFCGKAEIIRNVSDGHVRHDIAYERISFIDRPPI